MPSPKIDRTTRVARAAVFTVFAVNGALLALWVVHIPVVTERTGVAASTLGMVILGMAGAGIVGMRLAGPAADRFGSRALVTVAACVASVAVLGPGFATGPVTLALALACFGFGNGALDVSMNSQAVQVERRYGRPVMAAFHALFSGGGLLGSLLGAAALHAGWDVRLTLTLAGISCIGVVFAVSPLLVRDSAPGATITSGSEILAEARDRAGQAIDTSDEYGKPLGPSASHPPGQHDVTREQDRPNEADALPSPPAGHSSATVQLSDMRDEDTPVSRHMSGSAPEHSGPASQAHGRKVRALAALAFALLLAEGVAGDWSTLQMRERLDVDAATAALAFGAFSTTMTAGRLATDRVSGAFGRVAVVRYGTLIAALGFAMVVVSPWVVPTLLGWALAGLGLSGGIPQIFTAAGNLGSTGAATDMSRVFSVGYLGLLAGPALIGWLTALVPLTVAVGVPLVGVLLCSRYAEAVAPLE